MVLAQFLRRATAKAVPATSKFAPKYSTQLSFGGLTVGDATKFGAIAGTFGVSLGTFAVFFFGEIPRVRNDILRQFPYLNEYYDRRIAPEDNPF